MITLNDAGQTFICAAAESAAAYLALDAIFSAFGERPNVEVHWTWTKPLGDLRIRALKPTGAARNVAVLDYREDKKFSVRLLDEPQVAVSVQAAAPMASLVREISDPLSLALVFDPVLPGPQGPAHKTLVTLIECAINAYQQS